MKKNTFYSILLLSFFCSCSIDNTNSNVEPISELTLNNLMELYRATIYRQTMFAEFERDISSIIDNDGALTADKLSNMYYDLNKFYFGDGVVVDDEIRYEWERIPHFYYDFYVYKYATGLSAATAIVKGIKFSLHTPCRAWRTSRAKCPANGGSTFG